MLRSMLFCESIENPQLSLPYKVSELNKKMYDKNFNILKSIVKCIIFCGKQNIPLRGHRDDYTSNSSNRGNFIGLLQLLAQNDQILSEHLDHGKRNAMSTSKTTQNEIINIIGDYIRKENTGYLQNSTSVYSIIADEVTDRYENKEILTVCLRFVQDAKIREMFFDFVELQRANGEQIAQAILASLSANNIDIKKMQRASI